MDANATWWLTVTFDPLFLNQADQPKSSNRACTLNSLRCAILDDLISRNECCGKFHASFHGGLRNDEFIFSTDSCFFSTFFFLAIR